MKALVKKKAECGLWMEDVPMPEYGPAEVLIKIKRTAICGTDIHIYKWDDWAQRTIPVPMVVGHEFSGTVAAVGDMVKNVQVGDLVSGEGHLVCGTCRNCLAGARHLCSHTQGVGVNRTGCFAEYLVIPAENVWKAAPGMDPDILSVFDPFGNATHTALSFNLLGEDVLITGAGPIGAMAAGIAKYAGARHVVITDVNDYRLDLAAKMGATRVVNVANENLKDVMVELDIKEGFDVGLEMSGAPVAFNQLLDNMFSGGKIAMLGIMPGDTGIEWDKVVFGGLTIKGIYGREMFETWYKMRTMVQGGLDLGRIITHRYHYTDFQKGFDAMLSGQSGKVVLNWED